MSQEHQNAFLKLLVLTNNFFIWYMSFHIYKRSVGVPSNVQMYKTTAKWILKVSERFKSRSVEPFFQIFISIMLTIVDSGSTNKVLTSLFPLNMDLLSECNSIFALHTAYVHKSNIFFSKQTNLPGKSNLIFQKKLQTDIKFEMKVWGLLHNYLVIIPLCYLICVQLL